MKFLNVENFEKWLENTCKTYYGNIDAYLNDAEKQYSENGAERYELKGVETRSGNPECYSYEVEEIENDGQFETTIIF